MLVTHLYYTLLFTWACLLLNWATIMLVVLSASDLPGAGSDAMWSSLYVVGGVPGAWRFWYRSMYAAARDDSGTKWLLFLAHFCVHIVFASLMALGAPGFAGAPSTTSTTTTPSPPRHHHHHDHHHSHQ
jgi:hypothetical protein